MRYFIGLPLSANEKLAIEQWREKNWRITRDNKPVPTANFHITLTFLGHVDERKMDILITKLSSLTACGFTAKLERFSVWQKPPIAWLGLATIPAQLTELQRRVEHDVKSSDIQIQERPYIPHVTLARKCKPPVPSPLLQPDIALQCHSFCLFNSISTPTGVTYRIEKSWALG